VFAASSGGSLAYRPAPGSFSLQMRWTDRQGKLLSTVGQPGPDSSIVLSPDGKRAVVKDTPYDVPGDLWTLDLPGEILFHTAPVGSSVFAVPVRTRDAVFESGAPLQLFAFRGGGLVSLVDSTPDGQRFVMAASEVEPAARDQISVVLNWPALLKR